jgi:osmoprotectant transport system permease protein
VTRSALAALLLCVGACGSSSSSGPAQPGIRVASKAFTENVILGEITTQLLRSAGVATSYRKQLGGTEVLWHALEAGQIDVYPEYTGTLRTQILAAEKLPDDEALRRALAARGIGMSAPLGFNNTYAIGMKEERAAKLGITRISDLIAHPELRFGFSNEFMHRGDGWPSLRARYGLPQRDVRGLDHDLAYRALETGTIDATDLYSTDAEIAYYHLRVLTDDRRQFPTYDAVLLYRDDLAVRSPEALGVLRRLEGSTKANAMIAMNAHVKLERHPEADVAAAFLNDAFGIQDHLERESWARQLLRYTREHVFLVAVSLVLAIVFALPLGVLAAKKPALGRLILGTVGIPQAIPSLALLVLMIPLLHIGAPPAIAALFLYSLLPIVRNTYTGLRSIPPEIRESAEALGLSPGARLRLVELPMASRAILAGIKTSAVINVGTATLGALIGAGGFGQPILTGIRLDDVRLMLFGAIPAALLQLAVLGLFDVIERQVVPKGLRLPQER